MLTATKRPMNLDIIKPLKFLELIAYINEGVVIVNKFVPLEPFIIQGVYVNLAVQ